MALFTTGRCAALFVALLGILACSSTAQEPSFPSKEPKAQEKALASEESGGAKPPDHVVSHADLVLPVDHSDPTWGSPNAPVTIVHFFDFQCPHSKRADETLSDLMEAYGPEKLRIVYKQFPLAFREQSPRAHDASIAIHRLAGSAAYRRFKARVFQQQDHFTPTELIEWSEEAGVPEEELLTDVRSGRPAAKVTADQDLGRDLNLTSTPTSFINGIKVAGVVSRENFAAQVEQELKATAALEKNGIPAALLYEKRLAANFARQSSLQPTSRSLSTANDGVEKWKLPIDSTDPIRGPRHAPVTIVIFSDFQCPFCERVLPTLRRIEDKYGNDVRVVWKDNPMPFHKEAKPAAQVARYIFKKKGNQAFWRAHDALFADRAQLGNTVYQGVLQQAGLSYTAFRKSDMRPLDEKIERSQLLAQDFDARGTPNFFINGVKFTGAQPFEKFQKLIDERLAAAKTMLASGVALESIYGEVLKTAQGPKREPEKVVPPPFSDTPYLGNKNAKISVQAFTDFQCPYCRRAEKTIAEFLANHPSEVVFYFRHLPLPFHKDAPLAAEASHEVYLQKGNAAFFQFRKQVYNVGGSGPAKVSRSELEVIARGLGVDMKAFQRALDSRKHQERIEADANVAKAAKISGVPAFVVGDVYFSGAQPLSKIESALRQAKKNSEP